MQTVLMARKLTQTYKFAARTAPELYEEVNSFVVRVASSGLVKFRGRKLGVEAFLNALVLDFMAKAEEERMTILSKMVPRFEAILEAPAKGAVPFAPSARRPKSNGSTSTGSGSGSGGR